MIEAPFGKALLEVAERRDALPIAEVLEERGRIALRVRLREMMRICSSAITYDFSEDLRLAPASALKRFESEHRCAFAKR